MSASEQLRSESAACRLSFTWFGTKKTLTEDQKSRAARPFDADGDALSASKRIIDTKHEAFKALTAIKGRAKDYWRSQSLPYTEDGIRLVRRGSIATIDANFHVYKGELADAATTLQLRYPEMRQAARLKLGELYDDNNYPASIVDLFSMEWDWPSVEPPDWMRECNPALYEQECERARARFQIAEGLMIQEFGGKLLELTQHLSEALKDGPDGRKRFCKSTIENVTEFIDRFKALSVRSSAELDSVVERVQSLVSGVDMKDLKDSAVFRQELSANMASVAETLASQIVTAPKRRIVGLQMEMAESSAA